MSINSFKWFENNSINSADDINYNEVLKEFFNFKEKENAMEYLDEVLERTEEKLEPFLTIDLRRFVNENPQYFSEKNEGLKHNQLKPSLDVVINTQFPKALQLVALATEYGHKKYIENDSDYLNYKSVLGGSQTYFNSAARHNINRQGLDESGLPHVVHVLWNYLAGLELWVEENKIDIKEFTENFMKKLAELK